MNTKDMITFFDDEECIKNDDKKVSVDELFETSSQLKISMINYCNYNKKTEQNFCSVSDCR